MQIIAPRSNQKVIKKQMHVKHKCSANMFMESGTPSSSTVIFANMFMESGTPSSSTVIFANMFMESGTPHSRKHANMFMFDDCCKCITHTNALMVSWLFGTYVCEVEDFEMHITGYLNVCLRHQLGKIWYIRV